MVKNSSASQIDRGFVLGVSTMPSALHETTLLAVRDRARAGIKLAVNTVVDKNISQSCHVSERYRNLPFCGTLTLGVELPANDAHAAEHHFLFAITAGIRAADDETISPGRLFGSGKKYRVL